MQASFSHSRITPHYRLAYAFRMSLNINIRALRQAKKLTIAQLASMVGISTAHLSEVERGVKNLNNHLMTRISAALGVPPDQLISDEASDMSRMAAIYSRLAPDDRERVVAFAAALASTGEDPPQN